MFTYSEKVRQAFEIQYGFYIEPEKKRKGFSQIPDGEYPLSIDSKMDLVRIKEGQISYRNFNQYVATQHGSFRRDKSGLWHYLLGPKLTDIREAVTDALANRPKKGICWFWFNKIPSPIFPDDTDKSLYDRWHEMRMESQNKPTSGFLQHLYSIISQ